MRRAVQISQGNLTTVLRNVPLHQSKSSIFRNERRRCVCICRIHQVLQGNNVSVSADVVVRITEDQHLARARIEHALGAVCIMCKGKMSAKSHWLDGPGGKERKRREEKGYHRHGSPNITTELTACIISDESSLAALCTICPP